MGWFGALRLHLAQFLLKQEIFEFHRGRRQRFAVQAPRLASQDSDVTSLAIFDLTQSSGVKMDGTGVFYVQFYA